MTLKLEDISKPKIVDFLSVKIDFFLKNPHYFVC